MSGRALLVVTFARALMPEHRRAPGSAASAAWADRELRDAFAALPPRSHVLTGGCPLGDARAGELAREAGHTLVEYRLDGGRYVDGVAAGRWRAAAGPCVDPHERNRAMAAAGARAAAGGYRASALALLATWSPTGGAVKTAGFCEEAGLEVVRRTCTASTRNGVPFD